MHTEGTILFSDPTLYDNREFRIEKWRWEAATSLLDIGNTEATASSLLGVLSPYQNETKSMDLGSPPVQYLITGLRDPEPVFRALCATTRIFAANGFTENGLHAQLREKLRLLETLQSYLMAHRGSGHSQSSCSQPRISQRKHWPTSSPTTTKRPRLCPYLERSLSKLKNVNPTQRSRHYTAARFWAWRPQLV